jgi:hypothetical protein
MHSGQSAIKNLTSLARLHSGQSAPELVTGGIVDLGFRAPDRRLSGASSLIFLFFKPKMLMSNPSTPDNRSSAPRISQVGPRLMLDNRRTSNMRGYFDLMPGTTSKLSSIPIPNPRIALSFNLGFLKSLALFGRF